VLPTQVIASTTVAQEVLPFTGASTASLWILGLSLLAAGILVLATGRGTRSENR
jgi:hypothetical protein